MGKGDTFRMYSFLIKINIWYSLFNKAILIFLNSTQITFHWSVSGDTRDIGPSKRAEPRQNWSPKSTGACLLKCEKNKILRHMNTAFQFHVKKAWKWKYFKTWNGSKLCYLAPTHQPQVFRLRSREFSFSDGYDSRSGVKTKKATTLTKVWGCRVAELGGWLVWQNWRSLGTVDITRLICEELAVSGRLSPSSLSFSVSAEAGMLVPTA